MSRSTFGILTALLQGALLWHFRAVQDPALLLKLQLSCSPIQFQEILNQLGPMGVELVRTHYWIDIFYPLAYGALLSRLLLAQAPGKTKPRAFVIPLFAAFFDEIENAVHYSLISDRILFDSPLFYVGTLSAWLKWGLIFLSLILLLERPLRKNRAPHDSPLT